MATLIELMSLMPWPEGADAVTQDSEGNILGAFARYHEEYDQWEWFWDLVYSNLEVASDRDTVPHITKSEWLLEQTYKSRNG